VKKTATRGLEDEVGDTLSLVTSYFPIISFGDGLFFNQVESWHGSVRSFHQSLGPLENRDEWKTVRPQWLALKAAMPFWGFVVVGMLGGLAILALQVPIGQSTVNSLPFVYASLWAAVLVYWLAGVVRLWTGYVRLRQAGEKIEQELAG
jgi:hypothetical protein